MRATPLALSCLLAFAIPLHARAAGDEAAEKADSSGFQFTTIVANPITSVKNQNRSGTCWAYSSLAFFESELLRQGRGEHDLCEMYVAHKTYEDRARAAVRLHGDISFDQGGSFYDALYCLRHYGLAPEDAMPAPGALVGDTAANFGEFFGVAKAAVDYLAKTEHAKLSPAWPAALNGILDAYMGRVPDSFTHGGKQYTPKSYAESLALNPDDYVSLTSYTHHPFYQPFILEIQDNWRWATCLNLPLNELLDVMEAAVRGGYCIAWGSDVSEDGFTRDGLAVMPDADHGADITGTDQARWTGLTKQERRDELTAKPLPELRVTQELRQKAYDNWETTDDHGMLIYGLAKDQEGKEYFMVKNSWGTGSKWKGTWYASKAFVAYKTMNIVVHKDAIPKEIRKKLGIK